MESSFGTCVEVHFMRNARLSRFSKNVDIPGVQPRLTQSICAWSSAGKCRVFPGYRFISVHGFNPSINSFVCRSVVFCEFSHFLDCRNHSQASNLDKVAKKDWVVFQLTKKKYFNCLINLATAILGRGLHQGYFQVSTCKVVYRVYIWCSKVQIVIRNL